MKTYYGLLMEHQEEYEATMCPICDERQKEVGENECKFCYRKGKFASSFINTSTPLHKVLDIMETQYGIK